MYKNYRKTVAKQYYCKQHSMVAFSVALSQRIVTSRRKPDYLALARIFYQLQYSILFKVLNACTSLGIILGGLNSFVVKVKNSKNVNLHFAAITIISSPKIIAIIKRICYLVIKNKLYTPSIKIPILYC